MPASWRLNRARFAAVSLRNRAETAESDQSQHQRNTESLHLVPSFSHVLRRRSLCQGCARVRMSGPSCFLFHA